MLSTHHVQMLHRALIADFTVSEFAALLKDALGVPLDLLTNPDESMVTQVFEVIQTAERAGWTAKLVRAAFASRPNHPVISGLMEDLGLASEVNVQRHGTPTAPNRTFTSAAAVERVWVPFMDIGVWRERLTKVENRVCRMELRGLPRGTGFLVGPDVVLTCYHVMQPVIEGKVPAADVRLRFDYRVGTDGLISGGVIVGLHSDWLVDSSPYAPEEGELNADIREPTSEELDYALLRLDRPAGAEPLETIGRGGPPRGWIRVPDADPKLTPQMPLMIAQYASGGPLKLAIDTEAVVAVNSNGTRVRYAVNTEPGSGGSPCFDANWGLVAIHHYKDPALRGPRYRQGIPIAAIRDRLVRQGKAHLLGGDPP
jgi:hypothetical protein